MPGTIPLHIEKRVSARLAHTHSDEAPTQRYRPKPRGPIAPGFIGSRRRELGTTEAVNAALHEHGLKGGLTETNVHKLRRLGYTVSKALVEKMHAAKAAVKQAAKAKKTAKKAAKKAAKAKKTAKKAAKKAATAKKAVKKAAKTAPKRAKKSAPKRAKKAAAKKSPKRTKKAAAPKAGGCRTVSHTEGLRIYNEALGKAGKTHVKRLPAEARKLLAQEGVIVEAKRRRSKK